MRSHFPDMSGREIVQRMLATARDVGPKGWDNKTGYGALIPYKALTARVASDFPNPVYSKFLAATSGDDGSGKEKAFESTEPPTNRPSATAREHSDRVPWQAIGAAIGFLTLVLIAAITILIKKRKPV
jgi:hypothetical protein